MMRLSGFVLRFAAALFCTAAFAFGAPGHSPADFSAFLERYYEDHLALFPVDAAGSGDSDRRYDHVWPNDISADARQAEGRLTATYLEELAMFDRSTLRPTERLSYDILKSSLATRQAGLAQPTHLLPVNQFWSAPLLFAQMGSGRSIHRFETETDYRNFIARADGFSAWVDTAIANMREGIARGIVQPRLLMERVLPQYEPLVADEPETNLFFEPLKNLPADLSDSAREQLTSDYLAAIRRQIIPAYARLHAFIKQDYLPHCRESAGLSALPGGADMYAYWVRYWTTTDRSPDEIHEIGLGEVARIRGEMENVQAQVGFNGTLFEFLDFVATDPQFAPFETEEDVLNAYRAVEARLKPALPKFFGHIPRTPFEIRATEKFRAASASAEYRPAAADGSRPGVFYVPVVDPKRVRNTDLEVLFLHEAIPGHHFQISIALERTDLPRFRRYGWNSAYVEGWALYTESLGRELGLYTDPYQYFGMLLAELHRAVRLVVDTGLHAKGWSREQALRYSAEQEGGREEDYVAEVERYMALPGQALSYKLGQLKILELRRSAETRLGDRFDLRAFHDHIMEEGALPLDVLGARHAAWISAQH